MIYSSNDFYVGLKIIMNSEPYVIESNEFVKPGKGQAFVRVKLRRLLNGSRIEKTFKSTDSVKGADVIDINLKYLYNDNKFWYFINEKTFEQLSVSAKIVGSSAKWILNQSDCILTLWNNQPIAVVPPNFIEIKVTRDNLNLIGITLSNNKLITLPTGITVKVPTFIRVGDTIKIDTRSGEYVSRIK